MVKALNRWCPIQEDIEEYLHKTLAEVPPTVHLPPPLNRTRPIRKPIMLARGVDSRNPYILGRGVRRRSHPTVVDERAVGGHGTADVLERKRGIPRWWKRFAVHLPVCSG